MHDFASLVREYLTQLDRAATMTPYDLLQFCAVALPRIYASGLALPNVEPDNTSPPRSVKPPPLPSFGRFDLYSNVFDPYGAVFDPHQAAEPVLSSLRADLEEIYTDLAEPLLEYDAGRIANATWSWRFNITTHCGDHLVDALRAIHRLVNDHMAPDYDPDGDAAA